MNSEPKELPPRGRVRDVVRDWMVLTDGEFAHRLQNDEITHHLVGNRTRNTQIREDFPTAAAEQRRVEETALEMENRLRQQAEEDAKLAKEIQALQKSQKHDGIPIPTDGISGDSNSYINISAVVPSTSRGGPTERMDLEQMRKTGAIPKKYSASNSRIKTESVQLGDSQITGVYQDVPESMVKLDISNSPIVDTDIANSSESNDSSQLEKIGQALGISKNDLKNEKLRLLQEEKDAEMARMMRYQDYIDESMIKDMEFALSLHNKEIRRYRKHKEKQKQNLQKYTESRKPTIISPTYETPVDAQKDNRYEIDPASTYLELNPEMLYMEPISTVAANNLMSNTSVPLCFGPKSLSHQTIPSRPPPTPPRPTGRPKMAEPVDVLEKCTENDDINDDIAQPTSSTGRKAGKKNKKRGFLGCSIL